MSAEEGGDAVLLIKMESGGWVVLDPGDGTPPTRLQARIERSGDRGGAGVIRLRIEAPPSVRISRKAAAAAADAAGGGEIDPSEGMRPRTWGEKGGT